MAKLFVFLNLLILIFGMACGRETEDPARMLILEGVKVMGGEEALRDIRSIERTGKVKAITADGTHEGTIVISIRKDPPGIRIIQTFGRDEIIQAYDGKESWNRTPYSAVEITPAFNDFFRVYALLHTGSAVIGLGEAVELALPADGDEATAGSVNVLLDQDLQIVLSFDPTTGFLAKSMFNTMIGPDGENVQYSITYHNYKKIGALRLPQQWKCYYNNELIAWIVFSETTLNPLLEDALFQIPVQEFLKETDIDAENQMPAPASENS